MKLPFYGVAVIVMCLFAACGKSSMEKNTSSDLTSDLPLANAKQEDQKLSSDGLSDSTAAVADTSNAIVLQSGLPNYTDWDKKIIKTGKLSLEVKDYKTFTENVHNRMKSFGAYTASEQQNQSDSRIENNLTIKVPVDQFDGLINSISGDDITMLSKDISTDDVSNELIDTKARIEAKNNCAINMRNC